ncbi:MAG: UTP--glucose-1-phosphate uridylyltransferase [Planctomycetia bacterium]|nr:UTP--glucose-1-phosphate uridylyltransferase [Planctomycetia bacterium]
MPDKQALLKKLAAFQQEQVLEFWDELTEEQRSNLAAQIDRIDFSWINELYTHRNDPPASAALAYKAKEPVAYHLSDQREKITPVCEKDYAAWNIKPAEAIAAGEEALRKGKIAAAVVAGGQGTRLDFLHAKGIFPIGPISGVSLFQIHIERIRAMQRKYHTRIPFCIQTSPATHQETIDYFKENDNFGLDPEDVLIFCQGTMPSVEYATGKLLLSAKDRIAVSPDGHGGFLAAINLPQEDSPLANVRANGILSELQRRGYEEIFYFQIDNPLIDICSPEFMGYHILSQSEFSTQVIRKQNPLDRVGNMVVVDGRLYVIEYSDLPNDVAERRKPDGSLEIWAGSIAVHGMNIEFLKNKAFYSSSLPFHIAKKKISYVVLDKNAKNESGDPLYGTVLKPDAPNAIKFEKFIFDLIPLARNPIVVEVDIQTCFEPLKNHPSQPKDNPQTVRRQLCALYKRWLNEIGIQVAPDVSIEISPLFANSAIELESELKKRNLIPASRTIEKSVYWE